MRAHPLKVLLVVTTILLQSVAVADVCKANASKTAKLIEAFSQETSQKFLSSVVTQISSYRAEGLLVHRYAVEVRDSSTDGYSLYHVGLFAPDCGVVKSIDLITQD